MGKYKSKFSYCLLLAVLVLFQNILSGAVIAGMVTAKGEGYSRKTALADALRNAISMGAGVAIVSKTSVRNFELEMDRIVQGASGIVLDYKIINEDVSDSGDYLITVQANVDSAAAKNTFANFKQSARTQKIFQKQTLENRRVAVVYNRARKDNLPQDSKGALTLMDRIRDELVAYGFRVYLQDDLLRIYAREGINQTQNLVDLKVLQEAAREAGAEILIEVRMTAHDRSTSDGHAQVFTDMDMRMVDVTTGAMFASVRQTGKTLTYQGQYQIDEGVASIAVKYGKVASERLIEKIVERLSGAQQKAITLIFKNLDDGAQDSIIDVIDGLGWDYQIPKETETEMEIEVFEVDRSTVRSSLRKQFKTSNMKFRRTMQGQRITYTQK